MDIKEQIQNERSRGNSDYIAAYIGNNDMLFYELMQLVFNGPDILPLWASWIACIVTDKYPGLLEPYVPEIIDNFKNFRHKGIIRNLLRQLAQIHIPHEQQGILFDTCYNWLYSKNEPIAVKVHSMQVLYNISQSEPDLKNELYLVLDDFTDDISAGIRNRAMHLRKKLSV